MILIKTLEIGKQILTSGLFLLTAETRGSLRNAVVPTKKMAVVCYLYIRTNFTPVAFHFTIVMFRTNTESELRAVLKFYQGTVIII